MTIHRSPRRAARAVVAATMLLALGATSVAAHSQTVDPNGNGDGFTKPISNPWAQAHCNSSAPEVVAEASTGVVRFSPAAALPCPAVPNPGGQVHPGAGS
jgi:hypothetical protein